MGAVNGCCALRAANRLDPHNVQEAKSQKLTPTEVRVGTIQRLVMKRSRGLMRGGALTDESKDVSSAAPAASADLPAQCSRSVPLVVFAFIALAVAEVVLVLMMPGINYAGADGKAAQAEILITLEFARP
ncbi:MAG: hypothetical protein E6G76_03720, partial [Alphaproteobacteria bacterium]